MNEHDRIVRDFIKSLKPVMLQQQGMSLVMTIFESVTFGVMLLLTNAFGMKPQHAVRMVEAALGQAIERFAAENNKENET